MGDIPLDASNIAVSSDISSVMYISSVMEIIYFLNTEINEFDFSVVSSEREVTLRLMKKCYPCSNIYLALYTAECAK